MPVCASSAVYVPRETHSRASSGHCQRCGDELRLPFPCKGRGFCPSCMGRRMAEGAALLVDHVHYSPSISRTLCHQVLR